MSELPQPRAHRFAFGRNWRRFLSVVDEDRIREAERSLREGLDLADLAGRRFLDVGSGSGLFSLAARRLGARVHSFDFDPGSVACTAELRRRHFPDDPDWSVERGSILDPAYVDSLGGFDVVYAWGVLHHTGDLATALRLAQRPVKPGGLLWISIYNDQGVVSRFWAAVKRGYVSGPLGRWATLAIFVPAFLLYGLASDAVRLRAPWRRYVEYRTRRGMSVVHDWIDWLGGYPYEVARPSQLVDLHRGLGFELVWMAKTRGLGTNEFVFRRTA